MYFSTDLVLGISTNLIQKVISNSITMGLLICSPYTVSKHSDSEHIWSQFNDNANKSKHFHKQPLERNKGRGHRGGSRGHRGGNRGYHGGRGYRGHRGGRGGRGGGTFTININL